MLNLQDWQLIVEVRELHNRNWYALWTRCAHQQTAEIKVGFELDLHLLVDNVDIELSGADPFAEILYLVSCVHHPLVLGRTPFRTIVPMVLHKPASTGGAFAPGIDEACIVAFRLLGGG